VENGFGRRTWLCAATAASLATLIGIPEALAAKATIKPFIGGYRHVGGDKERKLRDRAIDDATATMSGFVRGIARDMLRSANAIPSRLDFASNKKAKSLTVKADEQPFTAPLDGSPVKVKVVTGDLMNLHYDLVEGRLDQIFRGDDRGRTNRFTLASERLVMRVTVSATQLPKNVVYTLTYERA